MEETPEARIAAAVSEILDALNYDKRNQHLLNTPMRVARAMMEFALPTEPETEAVARILGTQFKEAYDQMVVLQNVPFNSMCSHHMLKFSGVAHIGYIPEGRIVGVSKLARLLHYYTNRLTVQELATNQVAVALQQHLHPKGVIVVLDGEHLCMTTRGVKAVGSRMKTSMVTGCFLDDTKHSKSEFLSLIAEAHP